MECVCSQECSRPQVDICVLNNKYTISYTHTHRPVYDNSEARSDDEFEEDDDSDNDMDDDGMYLDDDDGDDYEGGEDDDVRIMTRHQK